MNLNNFKETFFNSNFQGVEIDLNGKILSSDNNLFDLKKGNQIQELSPFFESLLLILDSLDNQSIFSCIELKVEKKKFLLDVSIIKENTHLLLLLCDFTNHYNESNTLIQEKNESTIRKNELLFEKELLLEKEKLKNTFLAKLSNELRNPLNTMMSLISLMNESKVSYEHSQMLQIAKKTGTHAEMLLNDLLDIGRISKGVLELKKVPFKITDVAKHIEDLYTFNTKNNKIQFRVDIQPSVPKIVIGDPIRLKQILINLIENAYQRTKEGEIILSISQDYTRAKKASISFHIKDDGTSLDSIQLSKIFNEYYQIEKLLSPIAGQGLGLKIVDDLVALQNGKIQIKNKEDDDTTFIVSIPFQIPITLQKEKRVSKKAERGLYELIKVILIDDSEINQMILMKQFISEGHYQINLATNIEMTLNHLETKEIDVILIDLDIPSLDEFQLIKQLKENILSKNIPIIAISGKALPTEKNEVLDLGVKNYITKPYEKSELFKAINDLK